MTAPEARPRRLAQAAAWWDRALFAEVSSAPYAAMRVLYGLVLLGWAASLGPDLLTWYTDAGPFEGHPSRTLSWSILQLSSADALVVGAYVALVVAAACLVIGLVPRAATLGALVVLVSFGRRNPHITNSGDLLLRNLAFLLLLAPTGAALRVRPGTRSGSWRDLRFPTRPVWPLRLFQVQLAIGYGFSVAEKVVGGTWQDGTAVSYALRLQDLVRLPAPSVLTDPDVVVALLTWGALATEAAMAVLVFHRRLRPWVLAAGVALHVSIDLFLQVGFFSALMLVAYVAFVPPDTVARVLRRIVPSRTADTHGPPVTTTGTPRPVEPSSSTG